MATVSAIFAFIGKLLDVVGQLLKRFPAKTTTEKEGEVKDDIAKEREKQNETGRPVA